MTSYFLQGDLMVYGFVATSLAGSYGICLRDYFEELIY